MADTVTTQVLVNGSRNLVIKCTNFSDATGEALVKKIDAASATYAVNGIVPGIHLKLVTLNYTVSANAAVRLFWEASANSDLDVLSGFGDLEYHRFGGLANPAAAGATGSILLSTVGFVAGSSYTITFEMSKGV